MPRPAVREAAGTLVPKGLPIALIAPRSTATGDAEFFAACYRDVVRWDHRRGRFLVYEGHHWVEPTSGEIGRVLPPLTVAVSPLSHSNEVAYAQFPQRERLAVRKATVSACAVVT